MTPFQQLALLVIALWLIAVVVRFSRSRLVLVGGLFVIGLYTLGALVGGHASMAEIGLGAPPSWPITLALVVGWLALMLVYSPLADAIATRLVAKPPTLGTFKPLQESKLKLAAGIVIAWILGGFLEELVFRGLVLQSVFALAAPWLPAPAAAGLAILVAAGGAGIIHLYQGRRAVIIITQLSALFGLLFVLSGHSLWAVIACHGLYDTIAFVRFALKKSKYSRPEGDASVAP
jgi:membrane protease YdiL (CAAX protease family)